MDSRFHQLQKGSEACALITYYILFRDKLRLRKIFFFSKHATIDGTWLRVTGKKNGRVEGPGVMENRE